MSCSSFASFLNPNYSKPLEQEDEIPFTTPTEVSLARYSGLLARRAFKQQRPEDVLSCDECCSGGNSSAGHYTKVDYDADDEKTNSGNIMNQSTTTLGSTTKMT